MDLSFFRDAAVNLTRYVPFGVFCFLSMREPRSPFLRGAAMLAAATLRSSSIEVTQLFDTGRVCSLFDVACNTAGAAAGVAIAATFPGAISAAVNEIEAMGAFRLSGVVALLYLFAGYQLFPFFPAFSRFALRAKLAVLAGSGAWPVRDFFESLSGWLALSALVESLAGRKRFAPIVATALLVIPLKLLIAARSMTGSELAGALSGVACWTMLGKLRRRQTKLAVAVLALAGVEATQVYLPGRTPETTDPLLAILLGCGLTAMERGGTVSAPLRRL